MTGAPRARLLGVLALGLVVLLGAVGGEPAQARQAPVGQDPVHAGQPYTGDFPDPAVLLVGDRYYAYATTTDSLNLPTLTSYDARTWTAAPPRAWSKRGDALPRVASWAVGTEIAGGGRIGTTWAPTVTRLGPGRYVLAYAAQVAGAPGQHMCISVATAAAPYGPFVDRSSGPLVCPPHGAIDPQVFVAPTGRPWLVWKLDHAPPRLFTTPMTQDATRLLPGAPRHFLARLAQPWEGSIIENPAMIRYRGRYYLFYSANSYASTRYGVGYLICRTWYGGCVRPRRTPLLATGGSIAGPGGGTPFVDRSGRLRLAYAAWTAGQVGYPSEASCRRTSAGCAQRRLYVATLRVDRTGALRMVHRR